MKSILFVLEKPALEEREAAAKWSHAMRELRGILSASGAPKSLAEGVLLLDAKNGGLHFDALVRLAGSHQLSYTVLFIDDFAEWHVPHS
jgi:hypothetical protein